jgi:hypothetical protein
VGITVADEFFNRRGEVISHAHAAPSVCRSFRAEVFWIGKKPLRIGGRYTLKIATQAVEAEISDIFKVIGAATPASSPGDGRLGAGDVAETRIVTREPVVLDPFSQSRGTGRFVLVDGFDVSGGGIVIEAEADETRFTAFADGGLKASCGLFEEYYYSIAEDTITRRHPGGHVYAPGDAVPLSGKSFSYPEFFDIVLFQDNVAVKIREGNVEALLPLAAYRYEGLPVTDARGFAFRIRSRAEWRNCMREYAATPAPHAALAEKWLCFNTYRTIPISADDWAT